MVRNVRVKPYSQRRRAVRREDQPTIYQAEHIGGTKDINDRRLQNIKRDLRNMNKSADYAEKLEVENDKADTREEIDAVHDKIGALQADIRRDKKQPQVHHIEVPKEKAAEQKVDVKLAETDVKQDVKNVETAETAAKAVKEKKKSVFERYKEHQAAGRVTAKDKAELRRVRAEVAQKQAEAKTAKTGLKHSKQLLEREKQEARSAGAAADEAEAKAKREELATKEAKLASKFKQREQKEALRQQKRKLKETRRSEGGKAKPKQKKKKRGVGKRLKGTFSGDFWGV